jgi:ubiquinone/menaquinone biosynthesis C-methylase UbiE
MAERAEHRVCPWWLGYFLANPVRRLWQSPEKILAPYLRPGMRVLEPGPGMGFFTLPAARMVGEQGRVVAVEIQPKMLSALKRRAEKAGLGALIETRLASPCSMGITDLAGTMDFALLFAVAHEVPDLGRFLAELAAALKPGAKVLFVEPAGHVSETKFSEELSLAKLAGFKSLGKAGERDLTVLLERQTVEQSATTGNHALI